MSRIFIENLPKNINENEIRKRFSQKGELTDIQVNKEKRTAFVGFKAADQANDSVSFFNKTFIYSCKISVKLAKGFTLKNNETKQQEVSHDELSKKAERKKFDPFEEVKDDPEFESFLKVQRNIDLGKGKQVWKDDIVDPPENVAASDSAEEADNIEDEEEEKAIGEIVKNSKFKDSFEFTVKVKGLPYKIKKRQLKDFFLPIKPLSLRLVPKVKGIAYVSFENDSDLKQSLVKHRGFIDGRRIEIVRYQVKQLERSNTLGKSIKSDAQKKKDAKWKDAEVASEPIGESGRMYVRNLSYTCTEDDLRQLFEKYGPLTELHMPIDSFTKKPKGFAFVTFVFPEHAVNSFAELDKTIFQGRLLHLLAAHAKNETIYKGPPTLDGGEKAAIDGFEGGVPNKSEFKQKKQEELKQQANNAANWNTLFIRPNAVADIMAKKFEVNKRDLLTQSNKKDNVAIRMALGETQIVNEVRQFLTQNKVSLDSFSRGHDCSRSKTVILVKNLPAETAEGEITELFSKFGLVNRVILPPYGVTAIVDMQEPNEAKFAFKKLAYTNFKHHPLYLEWAPADVFDGTPLFDNQPSASNGEVVKLQLPENETAVEREKEEEAVDEELPEDNTTIFVKNLNFHTLEEDFRSHFAKIGRVYSAKIATKKSATGLLSMGYGFIQFFSAKDATNAIKRMQNSVLDEHTLEIKLSNRTVNKPTETTNRSTRKKEKEQKQTGSKICVKNIPFEATENDIKQIFGVHGQIKSVRLPKKLAGSSAFRGFGFVDFVTKEDAKRAFEVLSHSTHLYGRPLVLEWAKESSNADELLNNSEIRQVGAKMARYFGNFQNGSSSKRLKKSELLDDLQRSSGGTTGLADEDSAGEE